MVHIAMVIPNYEAIRSVLVVMKSILFYRHNPIHFHLLSNSEGKEIDSTIFETWQLPQVNVSFYSLPDSVEAVKWIPHFPSSSVYALAYCLAR